MIIDILLMVLMAPLVFGFGYHGILVATAFLPRRVPKYDASKKKHRFAILVPAHNESAGIEATIRNLDQELGYPRDHYDVFVIADNCTDNTAELVREFGVQCMERFDSVNRGKGWALDWAFKQLLPRDFDIYVIVDADCRLDTDALTAMNAALHSGDVVLQLNYVADNPDSTPISYASCVANFLENEYYNVPKSRLGLSVFLRGTGMAFHRSILEKFPWNASSIVEDLEFSLSLIDKGIPTRYLDSTAVNSSFPEDIRTFEVQRDRWSGGGTKISKAQFFPLFWKAIRTLNLLLADAAISLWLQSRALIIIGTLGLLLLNLINWLSFATNVGFVLLVINLIMLLGLVLFGSLGMLGMGITTKRLSFLTQLPWVIFKWIAISFSKLFESSKDSNEWIRSPRTPDEKN